MSLVKDKRIVYAIRVHHLTDRHPRKKGSHMSRISRRVLVSALPFLFLLAGTAVRAEPVQVTVMTQNLYVGAETRPILEAQDPATALIAAGEAVQDVILNNFPVRAGAIATEVQNAGAPLLIGLQEASIINVTGAAGNLSLDYTSILLGQLAARGLNYEVVGTNLYYRAEYPWNEL